MTIKAASASARLAASLAAGFGALALLAFGLARPAAAEDVLNFGYQKSSTLAVVLKANGELEKALAPLGIKVEWREFSSGLPLLEALNLGHVDLSADVADTVPIFAQAAKAKLVYFAEEAPSPSANAILVPEASPIRSLSDLRGRKIAVTKAAGSHFLLLAALQKAGLSFSDISAAYLTPADGRAAFAGGKVDAWVIWDPYLTIARRQLGARTLADATGIAAYKRYYLVSESFAEKHPDALAIVFEKLKQTGDWVRSRPQEAAALISGVWNIDASSVEEANSHRSYTVNAVTREGLSEQQTIADAFTREGLLPTKIDTGAAKIWRAPGS